MQENTPQELFNLLLSKDFDVTTLDSGGKTTMDIGNTNIFSFDFVSNSINYGTVVVLLGNDKNFDIFFGDNIGLGLERDAKNTWYDLLYQLRMFAKRNMMSFSLKNINKLKHTMQSLSTINEGWKGTSKSSYNPQKNKTKLIIRHSRKIAEGDQRFRNINAIFIENASGERFKLQFKNIAGARAMARHVSEGGTPYDMFGLHITETVQNINTMGSFLRVKTINESEATSKLIEGCISYNKKLKKNIKLMSGVRGYKTYTETWHPLNIQENEELVEQVRDLLIPEGTTDTRINDVLPVLANLISEYRTQKTTITTESKNTMKELAMFENWAQNITEGTWAIPDSPEAIQKLKEILKQELPVGVDATNATEVLYDIIGDDDLYDSLGELAAQDPTADARDEVIWWVKQNYPDVFQHIAPSNDEVIETTVNEMVTVVEHTKLKKLAGI
jgi:flagellin-specific chaperone FliS